MPEVSLAAHKKRYHFLDVLKIIAITLVCAYHFSWMGDVEYTETLTIKTLFNRFFLGISSTGVPLFFMINGSLMLNGKFDPDRHIRKIIILVLQYYVWRMITIFTIMAFNKITIYNIPKSDLINAVFFFGDIKNVPLNHLWFVPILVGVLLLMPLIKNEFDNFNGIWKPSYLKYFTIILLVFCFILGEIGFVFKWIAPGSDVNFVKFNALLDNWIPFRWILGAMVFYFIAGGLLFKFRNEVQRMPSVLLILFFLIGAASSLFRWYIESRIIQSTWDNVFNGYITIPTLLMSFSLYAICAKIPNCKFRGFSRLVEILGENTMSVYYIHWIIGFTILGDIWGIYIQKHGIILNYIKAFVIVIACSAISVIFKKIPYINRIFH